MSLELRFLEQGSLLLCTCLTVSAGTNECSEHLGVTSWISTVS
jgi:hypothetical protein